MTSLEKIDIHETELQLTQAMAKLQKDKTVSVGNRKLIKNFIEDSAIGMTATYNARVKEIGARARLKNLYLLKVPARFFKKDFDKIGLKEMKAFVKGLKSNEIKKENEKPYSEQTKSNFKKTFKLMLRWIHKEGARYFELTKWIDTRYQRKDPDSLTEEEVKIMVAGSNTFMQKFLVTMLYSTGTRIEEFLNIRFRDCRLVDGDVPYYVITARSEYSKTKGRDIDLLWSDSTEVLKQWIESHKDSKPSDPLFSSGYDATRMLLGRISKRTINKLVTPHLMRHSATTLDASSMNHQQLCIKYGWAFSSNMPDIYIQRAGVDRKKIVATFKSQKFDDVKKQNEILQSQVKKIKANEDRNRKEMQELKRDMGKFMKMVDDDREGVNVTSRRSANAFLLEGVKRK